jgi:hypothetical protein
MVNALELRDLDLRACDAVSRQPRAMSPAREPQQNILRILKGFGFSSFDR